MATFVKINDWVGNMSKTANVGTDQFRIALSNTAPGSEGTPPTGDGDGILANITQVSYANLSSRNITTTSSNTVSGTLTIVLADLVLTASGNVADFRYVYVYDDTTSSPADALVGYIDFGSTVSMVNNDTFTIDFAASTLTFV